jgi:hypothetical protein
VTPMRRTRSSRPATLALLGAVLSGACSTGGPAAPADSAVSAARANGGVEITNGADGPIAYTVLERQYFLHTLALWGPCPDLEACTLEPGASTVVPDTAIGGYTPDAREAVVLWWDIVPDGSGGFRVENPQSTVVPLVAAASAVDAVVAFVDVEGGCWALDTRSVRYEPIGLPPEFRVPGLAVHAVVTPANDAGSFCMVGRLVRILSIEKR